jgi:hypothetical protein
MPLRHVGATSSSPVTIARRMNPHAAAAIWTTVAIAPGGISIWRLIIDPTLQFTQAIRTSANPRRVPSSEPLRPSTTTPIRPIVMPIHSTRCGHRPKNPPHTEASMGWTAMIVAATPELSPRSSASVTSPTPPISSMTPISDALRACRRVGHAAPRHRAYAPSRTAAMTKRVAWSTNGSNVSSPYRIARYVDPQITHTPPSASTTSNVGPERVEDPAGASVVTRPVSLMARRRLSPSVVGPLPRWRGQWVRPGAQRPSGRTSARFGDKNGVAARVRP